MSPTYDESSEAHPDPIDPRDHEIRQLRLRLDEVSQQLLVARDAILGAEAELSAARARTSEVEHHLHVRIVEVTELRQKILQLSVQPEQPSERPNPMAKRLSPLLARTHRLGH